MDSRPQARPTPAATRLPRAIALAGGNAAAAIALVHLLPDALAGIAGSWGFLPSLFLYNRLNRATTFENDTRRRIFDHVREMPGVCIADIAQTVGVSHSTASYHLDKLHDFSLITSTQDGNKVRFFVKGGAYSEEERIALAALENPETRRVLSTIAAHPMCYRAELTVILDVSSPTVNWHLERLTRSGLVTETRAGRNRYLQVDRARAIRILSGLLSKLENTGKDTGGIEDLLRGILATDPGNGSRHAPRVLRERGELAD